NPPQREAVLHHRGPLLILAGAGSGKTRVITHRIARLTETGLEPERVLAITFTNKAAEEMRERTERLCGVRSPWISTFHSFCARILRRHIHLLEPYDNRFTIYDAEDSRALVKSLLEEAGVPKDLWTPRAAQAEISRIKNRCLGSSEREFGGDHAHGQVLRAVYNLYTERLRERNALDFDDLLLLTVRLFEEQPRLLARYQEQFQHVLVDEFQDTNAIQYRIGRLLTAEHRNFCITGDPDQSIYRWRGADISNILNFEHDYPDVKVVLLEQNYRSTKRILHVANALISHNDLRRPKSLWTENGPGEPVRVYRFLDESQEAREVADLIQGTLDEGVRPGDIAVFYRINSLSRVLEQALIQANLPYSIVGGLEYFLRKEVKDLLAYLRILDNPRDAESLLRIVNVPPRGIGKSTIDKLVREASRRGWTLLETIMSITSEEAARVAGKKAASALAAFGDLYRSLAAKRGKDVAPLLEEVIRATAYEDSLRSEQRRTASDRVENIWELVHAAEEYDAAHAEGSLTGFLEMANLFGDVDRWERREDRITLMTLHSAKGLEFPVVVIVGVEDGILPLLSSEDSDPDFEEERRLLYVGITRARERLYVTHAQSRRRHGRLRSSWPSRFLEELLPRPGEGDRDQGGSGGRDRGGSYHADAGSIELDPETEESLVAPILLEDGLIARRGKRGAASDAIGDDIGEGPEGDGLENDPWLDAAEQYPVGCRVRHETYGDGEVVRLSGVGRKRRVTVLFDDGGEKQFVLGFAPLRRLRQ
ncbi:MAG: UvrD-helicase domain-containing protein, partial [Planctomycetes bacterium]|nr:UvrD-helicase domain-containing protein [Planctomycetota bacterium]